MPRKAKTTADYSAHIITLWQICMQNKLSLTCDSPGQAIHYRQQMYAYRLKARQEGKAEATFMDDYTLEVSGNVLTGKISGIGRKIGELLAITMSDADPITSSPIISSSPHHNPLGLTSSEIPMPMPEILPPTSFTPEDAIARARQEAEDIFTKRS